MISLRAEGLGKAYRMYKRPIDSLKEVFTRKDYAETFWALKDVTFEVGIAGSLGIIGDNGAGKSTLLKLLAGAASPTVGRVERVGRTSAMLSLGAGFHPDLSGAENIRIGCAVLGLSPAETEEIAPRIVEFSELGSFIDRPVRTYSSGMNLRLGFSVATAINPSVLVVDEHLSVGDQHFRYKCMRRIMELRAAGCTLVFCSHDLHAILEVCDRVLWLRDGTPAMLAAPDLVVKSYQDHVRERDGQQGVPIRVDAEVPAVRDHAADTFIREVVIGGDCKDGRVRTGQRLEVRIMARVAKQARQEGVHVGVLIIRNDAVWCYGVTSKMDGLSESLFPVGEDEYGVVFAIDDLPLLSGTYGITVALVDDSTPHYYDTWAAAAGLTVHHDGRDVGIARIAHEWRRP